MQRKKKAALTAGATVLNLIATSCTVFVVTPFLVRILGLSLYGAWMMAFQMIGYLNLLNLQSTSALKLRLGIQQHLDNRDEKRRLVGAAMLVGLIIFPVFVLFSFVLAHFAPSIAKLESGLIREYQIAVFLLGLNLSLSLLFNIPIIILRACNLDYKGLWVRSLLVFVFAGLDIVVLLKGFGIIGIAFNHLILSLAQGVWLLLVVRRNISWFGLKRPEKEDFKSIFTISVWSNLGGLANTLGRNSDILFIGVLFGTETAGVASITSAFIRFFSNTFYSLQNSLAAGIQDLIGRKNFARLGEIRYMLHSVLAMVFLLVSGIILYSNGFLIKIWTGKASYGGPLITFLFILLYFSTLMNNIEGGTLAAFLKVKLWATTNLVFAAAGVITSCVIGYFTNITFFLIILLLSRYFLLWFYNRWVSAEMDISNYSHIMGKIWIFVFSFLALLTLIRIFIMEKYVYIDFIIGAGISLICGFLLWFLVPEKAKSEFHLLWNAFKARVGINPA